MFAAVKSHPWRAVIAAVLVVFALIAIAHVTTAGPSGFNNPATLDQSVRATYNANTTNPSNANYGGYPLTSVTCIAESQAQVFECIGRGADGTSTSVTVIVAANGASWISE